MHQELFAMRLMLWRRATRYKREHKTSYFLVLLLLLAPPLCLFSILFPTIVHSMIGTFHWNCRYLNVLWSLFAHWLNRWHYPWPSQCELLLNQRSSLDVMSTLRSADQLYNFSWCRATRPSLIHMRPWIDLPNTAEHQHVSRAVISRRQFNCNL